MTTTQVLKKFFEAEPHGRKLTMDELKDLTKEQRHELASMAAKDMGVELTLPIAA